MDYNTQRVQLPLPEYGRNVQQMVDYLLTIDDREKRSEQAQTVMQVMLQLAPQMKDQEEYHHKVWDHLHVMANFQLDIDGPYPKPLKEDLHKSPERIPYQLNRERSNHYGSIARSLLEELAKMPESPDRQELAIMTANQMKRSYLTWNKNYVDNADILRDVKMFSQGVLELPEDTLLQDIEAGAAPNGKTPQHKGNGNNGRNKRKRKKKRS